MLNIGQTAPDFELLNQNGEKVTLSQLRGQKVVIFAFPKANTAGCNAQACSFRDEFPRIQSSNAVVFGVSTDTPEALKKWKQDKKLPYDLLSDPNSAMLEAWGAKSGMTLLTLVGIPPTTRSYWVVDEKGVLIAQKVGIGPNDSVIKALQAVEGLAVTG